MSALNLIAIGYAKRALVSGSREQQRMMEYANVLGEFHLIVFTRASDGLPKEFQAGNLHVYGTHTRTKFGMLWQAVTLGKKIIGNHSKQYVVSSQDPFETSWVARRIVGGVTSKHHVQLHGDFYGAGPWQQASVLNRVRAWYGLRILRSVCSIRVVSKRIKDSLVSRGVAANRITILPIAASLESFLRVKRPVSARQCHQFIFAGRLAVEKNIGALITAMAELHARGEQATLTLLGEGPLQPALEAQIKSVSLEDVIRILPWTDNVPQQFAEADTFVLASHHEGYGLVLIEAMAAGLPVITTDVGCVGEVVQDGVNGQVSRGTPVLWQLRCGGILLIAQLTKDTAQAARKTASHIASEQVTYVTRWKDSFTAS